MEGRLDHKQGYEGQPGTETKTIAYYDCLQSARAFVPSKPFPRSLMFVGKARTYLIEEPFWCSKGRLHALATNNDLGCRGLPGTNTLAYYEHL